TGHWGPQRPERLVTASARTLRAHPPFGAIMSVLAMCFGARITDCYGPHCGGMAAGRTRYESGSQCLRGCHCPGAWAPSSALADCPSAVVMAGPAAAAAQ